MKKITFTLFALTVLVFSAVAQDTIDMTGTQKPNYMYYGDYDQFKSPIVSSIGNPYGGDHCKFFFTSDTLAVYGIASGIRNGYEFYQSLGYPPEDLIHDTSYANAFEYLRIYESYYPDSLHWTNQLLVHLRQTPISYYARYTDASHPNDPPYIVSMYEQYFPSPVSVVDSFYLGMTMKNMARYEDSSTGDYWEHTYIPLSQQWLGNHGVSQTEKYAFYNPSHNHWVWRNNYGHFTLIFPILMPDTIFLGNDTTMVGDTVIVSDSIIIGGDTIINYDTILALPEAGLLGRLVGVMPNPAGTTAKVVSSFGLTMVEAFNMAGERLCTLRLPDAPLAATLDVSRWPSGSYLLRIHTPQGVITRKLMVRR